MATAWVKEVDDAVGSVVGKSLSGVMARTAFDHELTFPGGCSREQLWRRSSVAW
jgi:hypothetical protein